MENLKTEVEHLKEELSKAKEKEHIFRFGPFNSEPLQGVLGNSGTIAKIYFQL